MDGLLNEVVAGEPSEVKPVSNLPFHVAPIRFARTGPKAASIVSAIDGADVTDGALVDLLENCALGQVVAPAKAGHNGELALLGFFDAFHNGANAGSVCSHRFFAEDVFVGFDGSFEVRRTEAGRSRKNHEVNPAFEDLLASVEANEAIFGADVNAFFDFAVFFQRVETSLEPILKGIAHRGQDYVFVRVKGLFSGAGAASTTADKADFDGVAGGCGGGFGAENERGGESAGKSRGAGGFEKGSSRRGLMDRLYHKVLELARPVIKMG